MTTLFNCSAINEPYDNSVIANVTTESVTTFLIRHDYDFICQKSDHNFVMSTFVNNNIDR